MDWMSKFTYPHMQIRMQIPAREAPWMRIHIRIPVQEDLRLQIHIRIPAGSSRYPWMQIFVTYLNNISYCQIGATFVTEYRLFHYYDHTEY